ncbi:unnamed protein product [Staurois parvus]|uniref:Transposase Tc1-like domain-containing protein n=1 Tax=Staurois parvus TaxID=386267 RepID=A0ABN9FCU9_9NEOB|nr:unnamed protein product [Staurois parvus]
MGCSQELIEFKCGTVIGHISATTVCRELHRMGFHSQAAASKPYITKCNAKRQMQW